MPWSLIDGDDSRILERRHHLTVSSVRPSPSGVPDSVGMALCSLLGRKTEAPALTDRDPCVMAPRVGLEPTTLRLTAGCSTIELPRRILSCVQEGAARNPRPESRARPKADSSNECARCQTESGAPRARTCPASRCSGSPASRRPERPVGPPVPRFPLPAAPPAPRR